MRPPIRPLLGLATVLLTAVLVPRAICGHDADALFEGERDALDALARGVIAYAERDVGASSFHTGSERFDGEWALVTHQMTILALGQIVREHPELRDAYLPAMRRSAGRLITPEALRFGALAWGEDPLATLERSERGHAYLGYLGLALGMLREIDPGTPHAELHDRIERALARRLTHAPHALIETYPGESYPPDVLAVAASLAQHQRVSGHEHGALLERWSQAFRARWVDASGYLVQAGDAARGTPVDAPRGSGTALGAYFASFLESDLSRALHDALMRHGRAEFLGFGGIREHAPGFEGHGDVDSGPVLLGIGVSATGFTIASARIHGDRDAYRALCRTAWLFGVPVTREDGARRFVAGGPLGNALLLAMLTARRTS